MPDSAITFGPVTIETVPPVDQNIILPVGPITSQTQVTGYENIVFADPTLAVIPTSPFDDTVGGPGPHIEYGITTNYIWSAGNIQLPIASGGTLDLTQKIGYNPRGPVASFVGSMSSPIQLAIVEWTATRLSTAPVIPNPFLTVDPTWVLMSCEISIADSKLTGAGDVLKYHLSGRYVYSLPQASLVNNLTTTGTTILGGGIQGPTNPTQNISTALTNIPNTSLSSVALF